MDYQAILDRIHEKIKPLIGDGKVASYIPELASVSPHHFGMAIVDLQGRVFSVGAAEIQFSIQSISKLFGLTLAFNLMGDLIWEHVGREPSGNPFNSLVQLEREQGKPRNPFINAGALVIIFASFTFCTKSVADLMVPACLTRASSQLHPQIISEIILTKSAPQSTSTP